MEQALGTLKGAIGDIAALDTAVATTGELKSGVLHLQAAIDRLKVVQARWLREADARFGFAGTGARDAASWLASKGKTSKAAASKQAALGQAMDLHPELAEAVDAGDVSPDAAEALTPTLNTPHSGNVGELVAACKGATPAEARIEGARFRELHPPLGSTARGREEQLRQKRALRFADNGDGTTRIDGTLTNIDARIVQNSLRSLIGKPVDSDDRTFEQKMADALVQLANAHLKGQVKGGRSNLPVILVTIDVNDLNGNTDGPGFTSRGDVIPAEAVRKMTANAFLQRVILDQSKPLDVGRASRLASEDQWRTLVARDGGCRGEGCEIPPEWCEVDHIREWDAQHGETNIDLLVLWCVWHHHFRHRPGVELLGDANDLRMRLPDGTIVPLPPRGPTTRAAPPADEPGDNQAA